MKNEILCSVVVPLFNEELVVIESYKRLKEVMDGVKEPYEIIFVNDGSRDKTAEIVSELCDKDKNIKLIDFSRNFGHQIAITAGMDHSKGSSIVVIDGDLQDPPEIIPEMIEKWIEGYDVVYGKRIKREGETFFKKFTAGVFYRILRKLTDIEIPVDTGDFRLIDRKVCDSLKQINERNRYVRGLISWLGFKQTGVEYTRSERFAGETKYPLKKMIKFALDAITSFSFKPLKLSYYIGFGLSFGSVFYCIWLIFIKLFTTKPISSFGLFMSINLFVDGVLFIILGIIGEYVGRIYDETKNRPLYVVKNVKN